MANKKNRIVSKTRRANNEGSIFQRKDGRWCGSITTGKTENGVQKKKIIYGKSRTEVAQKITELTSRISSENFDYVNNSTISTLMMEWLMVFKKNTVTSRTFEGNIRNFKLHIEPYIGNMKIFEIDGLALQKIFNNMLDKDFSLSTVKKIKFLLNQFFEYGIDNKFIATNPVIKTKIRSSERKIYDSENKYKAIPVEVRNKFLECLEHHDFLKPLCLTMIFAGLRAGEVLALTWNNIDFDNKTIKVEKGVTQIPKFDENGKVVERITVVGDTKTACSVREVPMPDVLVKAVLDYKQRQYFIGKDKKIDLLAPDVYVFANDDKSVRTYSGTKKIFERFLIKYDLKKYKLHFHGLRHTYSNMLFEANQNPKIIQGLLGHKSVKTTITTYNSVDKSYFKQAADVLNGQFKEKPKEQTANNFDDLTDDDLEELVKLLEKRKKKKDFEM